MPSYKAQVLYLSSVTCDLFKKKKEKVNQMFKSIGKD